MKSSLIIKNTECILSFNFHYSILTKTNRFLLLKVNQRFKNLELIITVVQDQIIFFLSLILFWQTTAQFRHSDLIFLPKKQKKP